MTTAIVVARGGSTRLPNKALLPFGNSTLIGHKVDTLLRCQRIDHVVVGSDSPEILDEAQTHGASVVVRDAYHCDEARCSANEMIADMVGKVRGDLIVWAHPTNPLVRPGTYDRALAVYEQVSQCRFDSVVSVYSVRRHAWADERPDNFNPFSPRHTPASELDSYEFQDGAIFIQTRKRFIETRYFYGHSPYLFRMNILESTDIDTAQDLAVARALYDAGCVTGFGAVPESVSGTICI